MDRELEPTNETMREQLNEYIIFVDEVLHPQLEIATSEREDTVLEIKEYNELQGQLQMAANRNRKDEEASKNNSPATSSSREALVDLGHRMIYCRAKTHDRNQVFVNVGMGFHVEFTLKEAIIFIDSRIEYLKRDVLQRRIDRVKEVASHLENALELLESLAHEIRNTGNHL